MKLTDATIKSIKATDKRQEIADAGMRGLYLTVQPKTGAKTWQVRYRAAGVQRRMKLGTYPALTIKEARARAGEIFLEAQSGADPAAEVRAAKKEKPKDTVAAALDDYAKRHLAKLKRPEHPKAMLDRFVRTAWGERPISSVTRADVRDLIDDVAPIGKGSTANLLLRYLKAFLNWCMDRDLIDANPSDRMRPPAKNVRRKRFLNDREVRWFWKACEIEGYPFGRMAQMLLVTGCRLNEIAQLRTDEITWGIGGTRIAMVLAPDRTKSAREHVLPLPDDFVEYLRETKEDEHVNQSNRQYLFTTTGKGPVSGTGKPMARIAALMKDLAEKECGEAVDIPHWTYHDLRRTCFTGVTRLGYSTDIAHAITNHAKAMLADTYDQNQRDHEKGRALKDWYAHIKKVTTCSLSDVPKGTTSLQVLKLQGFYEPTI